MILFILFISLGTENEAYSQRFPKPEFESGHTQPPTQIPATRSDFWEYADVFVLIAALSLMSWFVVFRRSRRAVFWLTIFSIIWFGFIREGCVCSVGSVQNVTLALFSPGYAIPITVIAFFMLPLIFTLLFGRTFCAGVCPLGAIQDIFVVKPLQLNFTFQKLLGIIPFVYLAFAILYAATETDFVICRYDPFIGIFRLNAEFIMLLLGAVFLLTSTVIARPYCRFFCPYGAVLKLLSKVSKYHLTITPSKCIQCKLCENSCPFGAINYPSEEKPPEPAEKSVRKFVIYAALLPVFVFAGAWTMSQFSNGLASVNKKVSLAQEIKEYDKLSQAEKDSLTETKEMEGFRTLGKSREELFAEAEQIKSSFHTGSLWAGGFIGLVIGLTLLSLSTYRYRHDYEPDKGNCLSCARCIDYCPVGKDDS